MDAIVANAQIARHTLSWDDVRGAAEAMLRSLSTPERNAARLAGIYGIPHGGTYAAMVLADIAGWRLCCRPEGAAMLVDDLIDSGETVRRFSRYGARILTLYRKSNAPPSDTGGLVQDGWLVFPWEAEREETEPTDAVVRLLQFIGEDPKRDGLRDTPRRVVKALAEMTSGLLEDPLEPLRTVFTLESGHADNMIALRNIPFSSLCEHHLLPFTGCATVAYIPNGDRVVGLSKLARSFDILARRPQVQERLTAQTAQAIQTALTPRGVGVIVRAAHECMSCRGIRKSGAEMVTSHLIGALATDPSCRAEFMDLARA